MKVLHKKDGDHWLQSHGWTDLSSKGLKSKMPVKKGYLIPPDSGRKTAIARSLSEIFANFSGDKLLWITDFGIWPSSENPALFDAYRRSFGETSALHETPYHLLSNDDIVHLECLLDIVLYFFWDAVLVDSKVNCALRVSNDECLDIYFSEQMLNEGINYQGLDVLELKSNP